MACWEQFVVISCLGTQFVVEFKGTVFTVSVIVMQLKRDVAPSVKLFVGLMTTLELQC